MGSLLSFSHGDFDTIPAIYLGIGLIYLRIIL